MVPATSLLFLLLRLLLSRPDEAGAGFAVLPSLSVGLPLSAPLLDRRLVEASTILSLLDYTKRMCQAGVMESETTFMEVSEQLLHDSDKFRAIQPVESDSNPEWKDQITMRGLVVSTMLGSLFCIVIHKLNLTAGIIPSLNVAAGLLGFFFIQSWTGFLSKLGFRVTPFTRQENTVIQTCVVACYTLAHTGGFGSYLIAMDEKTYELTGANHPGNRAQDVKNPSLGWMTVFLFVVSFVGIFTLVPLRKVMIMDYKLTYPSGTATAMLINSLQTKTGAELARKQVRSLAKYLSISFVWSCFKWFFSGIGDSCGFDNFPGFGLTLFKNMEQDGTGLVRLCLKEGAFLVF